MKKINFLIITLVVILFVACKKNTTSTPDPKSHWTFDGIEYKGYAMSHPLGNVFDASEGYLGNSSNLGLIVSIRFSSGVPTKSVILKVKKGASDNSECAVSAGFYGSNSQEYTSSDGGEEVTITVSSSGKLTASFSNISLSSYGGATTKMLSGVLIEQ